MKLHRSILPVVIILSACLLAQPAVATAAAKKPKALTLVSGVAGGTWFPIGSAVSEVFRKAGVRSNTEPGGAASNIIALDRGSSELGFTMSFLPPMAKTGAKPFRKKITSVAGVAVLFDNFTHVFVLKDAGIRSIADLKGKPFATQRLGTGTQVAFSDILKAFGLGEGDLKITRGSQKEGAELMKDRHVVGMTATTAAPGGTLTDLAFSKPVKLMALSDEKIRAIQKINPGYVKITLPAKTYPGQDAPVVSIGTSTILVVKASMPADEVYWITKALADNIDSVRSAHKAMKGLTVRRMSQVSGLPIHPGASRFYKEVLK